MQNFFGFIDYTKELCYPNRSKNQTLYEERHTAFNLFFSYNQSSSSLSLNHQNIFLFFMGNISNQSTLFKLLNKKEGSLLTTELIEVSYIKWGLPFIEKIEGSFIIVIYDKQREDLTLIKDNIGRIPLNYYHSHGLIIFGSRVTQFKTLSTFNPTINPLSLASYLQFGSILQPNTIFEGCYKVKSGHYTHFNLKEREKSEQEYWRLENAYQTPKIISSESSIIKDTHQLLQDSIEKVSTDRDEPIALSLSGGYDSSTITALLQEKSDRKLNTFTIGFQEESINEAIEAKKIAKHIGTEHYEHYFTGKDALDIIPTLCNIYDEPFSEYAGTPTVLTAYLVKEKGIGTIVVGDGGDEVFATADDTEFFQRIHSIPYTLREALTYPLKKFPIEQIPYLNNTHNLATKYRKFLEILSSKNIPKTVEARNILFREDELKELVKGYTSPILTTFDTIDFNKYHETVDEIIGTYFKTTMTDGELVKSYGAMNNQDITVNAPFLDEKLIAYLATVPSSIKIKDGIKKYILKEIAHKYIPKTLLDRPKSGFDIPFAQWMRKELKELLYTQINEQRLNKDKIFYTVNIIKIRDRFYQGNDSFKYKLWRIFIFQLWYENLKG
jgi:asparagine synthase (glutamine-hydrolysing)